MRQDAVLFEELKVYLQLQRRLREAVTWPKGPLRLGLIFSPTLLLERVLWVGAFYSLHATTLVVCPVAAPYDTFLAKLENNGSR